MKSLTIKPFRVRRPASIVGAADTLHELEWLGGEALVAPLPMQAGNPDLRRERIGPPLRDSVSADWIAP